MLDENACVPHLDASLPKHWARSPAMPHPGRDHKYELLLALWLVVLQQEAAMELVREKVFMTGMCFWSSLNHTSYVAALTCRCILYSSATKY